MDLRHASFEMIEELKNGSALTWEGLSEDSFQDALDWINEVGGLKNDICYTWDGRLFNESYGLTGSNAYPDDCTFFCVPLSSIVNVSKIAVARFQVGGRWLDDIIDNNARYQRESLRESRKIKKRNKINEDRNSIYNVSITPMERNICAQALKSYKVWVYEHPEIAKNVGRTVEDYNSIIDRIYDKIRL